MPDADSHHGAAFHEAARLVREALQMKDRLDSDFESAWAECSAKFSKLDPETLRRLRTAFEAGYRQVRATGRLVVVVPPSFKPLEALEQPPPQARPPPAEQGPAGH